ncbi:MAG: hypothetical protein IKW78_00855 [Prevotella sp.]|nr:hypothetical protein [Prevotella sp.]
MKKILSLFALLVLTVTGAQAQTYIPATGTNTLNAAAITSKADAGKLLVCIMNHTTSSNKYLNKTGSMVTSFSEATVWEVVSYNGGYALKNIEGNYMKDAQRPVTFTSNLSEALLFTPTDCEANVTNIASGFNSSQAVRWKLKANTSTQMNTNGTANDQTTTVQFNTGSGNWTCLFTYEVTINYNLVYKCYNAGESDPFDTVTSTDAYADGATVDITDEMVPEFVGKTMTSHDASVTINGANAEVNVYYTSSSYDYTLVVNGAPEGTTFTVKGESAASGDALSFQEAVTAEDVVASFPTGYEYMVANVTIDGTTITVTCEDPRWPVSFDKNANSTHNASPQRYTSYVKLDDQTINVPGQQAPRGKVYNDLTTESFTFIPGEEVQPTFGFSGAAMMGFVYIDLNNNGYFDEGELVSYNDKGSNPSNRLDNNNNQTPAFTLPTEVGSYRMRFKVDWASTDPAGATSIVENGGAVIDVTLEIVEPCDLLDDKIQAATNAYNEVSDWVGTLGYPTQDVADALYAAIEAAGNANGNCAEHIEALATAVNNLKAVENRVMPQAGNFYRIKGVAGGRYLQSTVSTTAAEGKVGERLGATETADVTTIFYLDEGKLLGYSNGMYVTNTCDFNSDVASNLSGASTFTITARDTYGQFAVKNGNTFLYSWDGTTNYCFDRQGSDHANCVLAIEPVDELPITLKPVGEKFYATFSAPVDIAEITGAAVTVNDVTIAQDNKTATTVEMDATKGLKAGYGVVLIADSYSEGSVVATIGDADESATTNLKAQYASEPAATHNDAGHYFLGTKTSNSEKVVGFYLLKSDGGKTGGFKAYIEKNATEAKEGFDLVFGGEVTGVETIDNGQLTIDNSPVYNLQGQRVNKAQKGVYIQNGKKVVVR